MPLLRRELLRKYRLLRPVLIHDLSQVLHLPFDYDDGSYARDRSGYGNHGTIYGATRVAGKVGGALSFDGVDDRGEVADSIFLRLTTAFTWSSWANLSSLGSDYERILGKYAVTGYEWMRGVVVNRDGGIAITVGGTRKSAWTGAGYYIWDEWHFYAVTWDGSTVIFYRDGAPILSVPLTGPIDTDTDPFTIGKTPQTLLYLKGILDEVRICNRALSAAEITRVMNMRGL